MCAAQDCHSIDCHHHGGQRHTTRSINISFPARVTQYMLIIYGNDGHIFEVRLQLLIQSVRQTVFILTTAREATLRSVIIVQRETRNR
jgi:hypothetical protein